MHEQSARGVHELKSTNKGPRTKVHEEKVQIQMGGKRNPWDFLEDALFLQDKAGACCRIAVGFSVGD